MPTLTDRPQHNQPQHTALYSRATGRRIEPAAGRQPREGDPVAVIVMADGRTLPISDDVIIGRTPEPHRWVTEGTAAPILVVDTTKAVSREHLLLRINAWTIHAIDLGSRNGTEVQTEDAWHRCVPGVPYPLDAHATLRLGPVTLGLHHLASA